nr:bifunctional epoxide hydrolase 2 [Quercus suber]
MSGLLAWVGGAIGIPAEVMSLQPKDFATLTTLKSPFLSGLLTRYNMSVDKLTPNDKRFTHGYTEVNGVKWHYLDAVPTIPQRGTVFLVHGWPDLALAWRYQIPMLLGLGMRCIAIDCMGYGETGVSPNLADYTLKAHADGIAGIAKAIGARQIILGGHDWGGMVVYRTAQWHPELVSHVFSVATPYMEPQTEYLDPAAVIARLPNFGYQLQLGSEEHVVEHALQAETPMRKFLQGIYGGKVASGKPIMTAEDGIRLDVVGDETEHVGPSPLMNDEVGNPPPWLCGWLISPLLTRDDEPLGTRVLPRIVPKDQHARALQLVPDAQTEPRRGPAVAGVGARGSASDHAADAVHPGAVRHRAAAEDEHRDGGQDPPLDARRGACESLGADTYAARN